MTSKVCIYTVANVGSTIVSDDVVVVIASSAGLAAETVWNFKTINYSEKIHK